jgi:hypothetical protein
MRSSKEEYPHHKSFQSNRFDLLSTDGYKSGWRSLGTKTVSFCSVGAYRGSGMQRCVVTSSRLGFTTEARRTRWSHGLREGFDALKIFRVNSNDGRAMGFNAHTLITQLDRIRH